MSKATTKSTSPKGKLLTASQITKIKVLSDKGLSERAVAAKLGVSRSSVNKHKNR